MTLLVTAALGLLLLGLGIVGVFGFIAFNRKRNAYIVSIEKDYRNPTQGRVHWYALYNADAKQYDLYKSLLSMKPVRGIANVDLKAFADNFGRVPCVRGVTGKPGDDMIVPIGLPINSQAAAAEYADKMSDAVTQTLYQAAMAHKRLTDIPDKSAFSKEQAAIVGLTETDLKAMRSPTLMAYIKYAMSPEWVMSKLGVRPISDAAVITIPQKNAIASLNSRANEFIREHASWLDQHANVFMAMMAIVIVAVTAVLIFYGASQFFSTLGQSIPGIVRSTVQASYNSSLNIYGLNLTHYVPK